MSTKKQSKKSTSKRKNPVCYLEYIPDSHQEDDFFGDDEYISLTRRDGVELLGLCCEQFKKFTGYLPPKSGKRVKVRFSVEVVK